MRLRKNILQCIQESQFPICHNNRNQVKLHCEMQILELPISKGFKRNRKSRSPLLGNGACAGHRIGCCPWRLGRRCGATADGPDLSGKLAMPIQIAGTGSRERRERSDQGEERIPSLRVRCIGLIRTIVRRKQNPNPIFSFLFLRFSLVTESGNGRRSNVQQLWVLRWKTSPVMWSPWSPDPLTGPGAALA